MDHLDNHDDIQKWIDDIWQTMTSDIVITASNTLSIIKPKRKIDRKNRKVTPAERNTARIFKELFILAHQLPDLQRKHRRLTSIEWINILTSSNNDYQHF